MSTGDDRLLSALQNDSNQSIAELAKIAGMSTSACQRRIKQFEEKGLIEGYSARLSPDGLGLTIHAFVEISLVSQSQDVLDKFEQAAARFDDILECHLMAGTADYLVRIAASDIKSFDQIHRECLARLPGVSSMRSSFSIRTIKEWRGYPVRR